MWKNKIGAVCNFLVKHSKLAFPAIVIAAVAVTVTVALNAGKEKNLANDETVSTTSEEQVEVAMEKSVNTEVPLVLNEDSAVASLIATYYNALALGDSETLVASCDEIPEDDLLYFLEAAKYIETYPTLEIYTKPGPEEGATIAYVYYKATFLNQTALFPGYKAYYICTNEQGERYIRFGENGDQVNEYIKTVSEQDDVVEMNNRIDVEYNQLIEANPELHVYMTELQAQIRTSVGVALAAQQAAQTEPEVQDGATVSGADAETSDAENEQESAQSSGESGPQYATAATTVNVRNSDSEQADKLGKVSGGTKLQVLEQRVNGWTKVLYEGKEGYIKSEFLQMSESADGAEVIGTVKATTNINVRASASETADRLGVLAGGDSAELLANENGWCKIKYEGQVGYVKSEYVEQ